MSDHTPPHDNDAEQAVLGVLLNGAGRGLVDDVADVLTGPEFYRPAHETVFHAVVAAARDVERVDPVVVARQLGPEQLAKVGGAPYLHTLMAAAPATVNGVHYAHVVREKATARNLADAALRIRQLALTAATPSEAVEDARAELDAIARTSTSNDHGELVSDVLGPAIDALEDPVAGLPTPWPDIDSWTHGLHPGQLIVIGARPAVGKSVLAANLAEHAARNGIGTYFATLEMAKGEVVNRLLAHRCRVNLSRLMSHQLSEDDWQRIAGRTSEIREWPLLLDDDGALSLHQLRSRCRSAARRIPLGLVVVDYLQLMRPRDQRVSREQQVAELSRGLKQLAKELRVPIVALAQLNRNAHEAPTMRDLRESGQIEADADQIWLLHRPDLYDMEDRPGELDVLVAKNRQGPQGRVTLAFQGHYSAAESFAA